MVAAPAANILARQCIDARACWLSYNGTDLRLTKLVKRGEKKKLARSANTRALNANILAPGANMLAPVANTSVLAPGANISASVANILTTLVICWHLMLI